MGLPMARHLLQAGHELAVYNRTRARADQLKQFNAVVADSPAAAARDAEVLVTMVADDAALEDVMLGAQGALAALPRGAIHVSMSTISPALSRRLAERHKAAGQTYVAAPVFGRPEAAEAKKLWIVAAGPLADLRELRQADRRGALRAGRVQAEVRPEGYPPRARRRGRGRRADAAGEPDPGPLPLRRRSRLDRDRLGRAGSHRRGRRGAQPPAIAGMTVTSSPSWTGAAKPPRKRTSSSFK